MGSKLGKSTLVPTRIGNTWGLKVLSFWTIFAEAPGGAPGDDPLIGSIHTTTPEKSMCLRTAASFESCSSTRPDTDPATRFVAAARLSRKLKKVCKREVIMRTDPCARSQIGSADPGGLKTRQDIRPKEVHDAHAVGLILAGAAAEKVHIKGAGHLAPADN